MSALSVVTLAQYLTSTVKKWEEPHWCASKFVKAVKGMSFGGGATVPVCGTNMDLNASTANQALDWAAQMVPGALSVLNPPTGLFLVPIPSSGSALSSPVRGRAHLLADAIARRHPQHFRVVDALWFKQVMVPSRLGGSRDVRALRDAMTVTLPGDPTIPIMALIVDDVITSGAHFQAARNILEANQWVVFAGFAVGRSESEPEDDPLAVKVRALHDPWGEFSYDAFDV